MQTAPAMIRDSAMPAPPVLAAADPLAGAAEGADRLDAIQAHGLLLVLHPATFEVLQRAGDATLLGADLPRPGCSLAELLPPGPLAEIAGMLAAPPETGLHGAAVALPDGTRLDVSVQRGEAGVLLEIERLDGAAPDPLETVQAVAARLQQAPTPEALRQAVVAELRRVSGFDRVLLCRFEPDGGLTGLAEARAPEAASCLGRHAPAEEDPRPGRAYHLQAWSRLIPDAREAPAPLDPPLSPLTGAPLDLSLCRLRSAPAAHRASLARLGARAAFTLPVTRGGAPWGLLACHHLAPRHLPLATRTACEIAVQLFALMLESAERGAQAAEAARLHAGQEGLVQALAEGRPLAACLPLLAAAIPGDAVAVLAEEGFAGLGPTPGEAVLRALAATLPAGVAVRDGQAALALRLAPGRPETVFWFRRRASPQGAAAAPWSALEVEAAEALRIALLEHALQEMEQVAQARAQAKQHQDLLLAELDHLAETLLASIQALARPDAEAACGLEALLADLHARLRHLSQTAGPLALARWEGSSLRALAEEHLKRHQGAAEATPRIAIEGPDLALRARAAVALSLALHELAGNAARHGALSVPGGRLRLAWRVEGAMLLLDWAEHGGPPVAPPRRRGFGALVIERSLARETGGSARLGFAPDGVTFRAEIPLGALAADAALLAGPPPAQALRGARILVAEDSAFVAMAMADGLEAAGAEIIGPVATVAEAEAAIAARLPDAALLDIDLDGVPVFPVADLLTARGVPIVFTTGYEPRLVLPPRYAGSAVLPKPCRGEEAAAAMRLALAER